MSNRIDIRHCTYNKVPNCLIFETSNSQFFDSLRKMGAVVQGSTRNIEFVVENGGNDRIVMKSKEPVTNDVSNYTDCLLIINLI